MDSYYLWLGIPATEQPPNHYRLLGVRPFEGNIDVLNMACEGQMALVRNYLHGPYAVFAQRLLNEIAAARLCLLTPDWKAAYDRQLAQAMSATAAQPVVMPASSAGPAPVPATEAAKPEVDSWHEEEPEDDWDSAAEEIVGGSKRRRRRGRNDGSTALLGLVSAVVVVAAIVFVWRLLTADRGGVPAKAPLAVRADHDSGNRAARKSETSPNPKASRLSTVGQSGQSASRSKTADSQMLADDNAEISVGGRKDAERGVPDGGEGMTPSPSRQVAPAFAARLDPRMNPDLASILESRGEPNNPAAGGMQQTPDQAGQRPWEDDTPFDPRAAAFDRVDLGAGLFLTPQIIDLTPEQVGVMVPSGAEVFSRALKDGTVTGAFSSIRGKLDGPAVEIYPDHFPAQFGVYEKGARDGAFRIWGKQHKRLFYSQYAGGVKHGIACVFRGGRPAYVEISDQQGVRNAFLIRFSGNQKPKVTAKRDFGGDDLVDYKAARARLAALETSLALHERAYTKQFADWLDSPKRQKTLTAAPGKRAGIASGPARDAQNSAIFTGLFRSAVVRSGTSIP